MLREEEKKWFIRFTSEFMIACSIGRIQCTGKKDEQGKKYEEEEKKKPNFA